MGIDLGNLRMRDSNGEWVNLGECTAMVLTLTDGTKLRSGDPAVLFDLEQTKEDKQLLAAMKVG